MSYLLDTCAISELVKKEPNANFLQWIHSTPEEDLFLSVITFGELEKGIHKLPEGKRRLELERWVSRDLAERFSGRVLDVNLEVATLWGQLLATAEERGFTLPAIDALVAASARSHRLTVVTRDTGPMRRCGVPFLDPW